MKLKRAKVIALMIVILCLFSIVGNMDLKQQQKTAEWKNSIQALELEQEKMQADIIRIQERLLEAEEELRVQNALVWDIRERLHLDLEAELEGER